VDTSPGIKSWGRAGLVVTAATAAANLLAYLPPLLAARRLSPADLGALATALALVAIATMPGVGLQTAVAVATARAGGPVGAARLARLTALACGGALVLGTPVLSAALRLPLGLPPLLAAMTVPAVLAGRPLGLLQGAERFGRLAVGTVALAVGRYAGVVVGLAAGFGLVGTFALGALVAWSVPPALWWLAPARGDGSAGVLRGRAVLAAASASMAILVASYADLILARRLLPAGESGAYAVGAVLTRAAIWAPQVVTIVALPRLARGGAALRVGLKLVVAAGVLLVAGAVLARGALVDAVGGSRYATLAGLAPYFVLIGAVYAVTVFLVNARIADGARRPAAGVWTAAIGLVALVLAVRPATVPELLVCSTGAAALSAVSTAAAVWARRSPFISAR
jgi:O-antigen/teichoic acid export membrane protein